MDIRKKNDYNYNDKIAHQNYNKKRKEIETRKYKNLNRINNIF